MEPGQRFARYTLLKRIAAGGMGELWVARMDGQDGFQKRVAIKMILSQFAQDPHFLEMFIDEARLSAQLVHPNICQVFELGEHEGTYFLTMEYLQGLDLRGLWQATAMVGNPMSPGLMCRIIADAAAGLDYAHALADPNGQPYGIVHRDISPQNIFVTFDGGVKVIDFGIAKARGRVTTTQSGVVKGKFSYMSPEQTKGGEIDRRSDVFALGIVFHEMLSNRPLFRAENELMAIELVRHAPIAPPSTINPESPASLDPIVMKALSRDLDQRYQTAHALRLDLEEWLTKNQQSASVAHLVEFLRGVVADNPQLAPSPTPALPSIEAELDEKGTKPLARLTPEADVGTRRVEVPSLPPAKKPWRAVLVATGVVMAIAVAATFYPRSSPFVGDEAAPAGCRATSELVRARDAYDRRDLENAHGAAARAIAECPSWAFAHHLAGRIAQRQDHMVEAEAAYREAMRLKPDWPAPAFNLALLFVAQKTPRDALPLLDAIIARDPSYTNAHFLRAQAKLALHDKDAARADLEAALKLDPANEAAKALLQRVTASSP